MTALRWSSDFIVGEYRDVQAKVITLDCTGRFLLLPSRKQLAIKDLTESIDDILLSPKVGKAEVVNASWNPHTFNKELCTLCVGPCIEILWIKNCEVRTNKILRSHTRAVTDVDWHAIDPNLFASSSLDTFTYVWDTRDYQKPVISFSSFAGASHVKWNKLSSHLLATTHGGDIKIWDERKNSSPVQYITAYLSNAFCIDWSPSKQNHISTASQDGNIKIYDIREAQKPHILIKADAPVWKVSYTPFGGGNTILGVMVPETKKSESSLLMWHLSKTDVPLHTFVGHTEIVLDMEWRSFKQDESEYQLITWGKDQTLRIWEVDKHLLQLSSQDKLNIEASTFPITSADAASLSLSTFTRSKDNISIISNSERNEIIMKKKTHNISSAIPIQDAKNSSDSGSSSQSTETSSTPTTISPNEESYLSIKSSDLMPANLSQEFAINFNIPNVHFDKMDAIRRLCSVTVKYNEVTVVLLINFPPSYPRNKSPVFRFIQGTTINSVLKNKLIRVLKDTAEQKVRNNEVCLEACILQVIATLDQVSNGNEEKSTVTNKSTITEPNKAFSETQESYVLTPRTCGAKFCHVGMLICFMKPKPILVDKNGIGGLQLQQRSSYLQNSNSVAPRTRYVLSQGLLKKIKISTKIHTRLVLVYDLSPLFLVNKKLAEKYVFTGNNVTAVCNKNAQIAATVGRKDLVEIWNLAMMAASSSPTNVTEHYIDWENHPFARNMIESMISHYSSVHDIQTAAMLACVFSQRKNNNETEVKNRRKLINAALSNNFPYHTVPPVETSESSTWNYTIGRHRSSSWSECLDDTKFSSCIEHGEIIDTNDTTTNRQERVLKSNEFFETLKILYADLLNRWQLLIPRTLVLKCISNPSIVHRGVEFIIECCQCKNAVTGKICPHCNVPSLVCIICRLSVKGSANFCLSCGHGGHTVHMQEWFTKEKLCPSGCKCECLKKTASFFSR